LDEGNPQLQKLAQVSRERDIKKVLLFGYTPIRNGSNFNW